MLFILYYYFSPSISLLPDFNTSSLQTKYISTKSAGTNQRLQVRLIAVYNKPLCYRETEYISSLE